MIAQILALFVGWLVGQGLGYLADVSKVRNWSFNIYSHVFLVAFGLVGSTALGLAHLYHWGLIFLMVVLGFLGFHVLSFAQNKRP